MKTVPSDYETKTGSGSEGQILFKIKMQERDINLGITGGFEYILNVQCLKRKWDGSKWMEFWWILDDSFRFSSQQRQRVKSLNCMLNSKRLSGVLVFKWT